MRYHVVLMMVVTSLLLVSSSYGEEEEEGLAVKTLTTSDFDELTSSGVWMIKFYAPWCGHCKHLAPIYEKVAKENPNDFIHFGKVDATKETSLAEKYNVKGYPRLMFKSDDGEMKLYTGKRTLLDLKMWTKRMSEPAVRILGSEKDIKLGGEKVIFVQCGEELEEVFNTVATDLRASITFVKLLNAPTSWNSGSNFVAKIEKNEKPLIAPADATRSQNALSEWIQDNRFPLVNILDRNNFNSITKTEGKKTVISVINLNDFKQLEEARSMLLRLARPSETPLSRSAQNLYRFGILDGVRWERFVKQFFITSEMLPHVFVLDGYADQFYNDRDMNYGDIETFLEDVASGKVYAQKEGMMGLPGRTLYFLRTLDMAIVKEQPAVLALLVSGITMVLALVMCCGIECFFKNKKEKVVLDSLKSSSKNDSNNRKEGKKQK